MPVKQVIVIRRDLQMRRGKEIAQGSHASLMFLRERIVVASRHEEGWSSLDFPHTTNHLITLQPNHKAWLSGNFAKVTVRVNSEEELLAVADKAKEEGVECHLVKDAGLTEFNGVPTLTCLALGPDDADKINRITGHLSLY